MEFFKFNASSYEFHARAKLHLQSFDSGCHGAIFYAALDLRFAIEARLYEYLMAEYRQENRQDLPTEYVATKLLNKLQEIDPAYDKQACVTFWTQGNEENKSSLYFTPVTKKLAKMHGQIGELLHFKFFINNPSWNLNTVLKDGYKNLADFRTLLSEVEKELAYALSGGLATHPKFKEIIHDVETNK